MTVPGDGPSPTQDMSYSQGQPRVKGNQGLGRGGTREGDVTPQLLVMIWHSLQLPPWEGEDGGGAALEPEARRLPSQ